MNKEVFKQIYKLLKKYDEIVIARHIGPDPDAVASSFALKESILKTWPNKKVYCVGANVSRFRYLGLHDKPDFYSLTNALLVVLDVPNKIRVDGIEDLDYKEIVKIDHHPKEDIIGNADFTSSDYSSTAEMVSEFLINTKMVIDNSIASKLFMGIVSDSERFLFKNTTVHTFEVVTNLIKKYNVDFTSLYNKLYEKDLKECKVEAYITNNLTITDNGLAYIIITDEIMKEIDFDITAVSGLINNYNFIKDFIVWCFITEDKKNEQYKVNLRSRGPVINTVASHYHGGGHNYASGARIYDKEDIQKLIEELDNTCLEYNKALNETDKNNQE